MVMTDDHLKVITLKPRSSREYLDLMNMIVNLEHYYRKMEIDKILRELPPSEAVEKIGIAFLKKYEALKKKAKKEK